MKKISVILSVYNCEEYLDDCLTSLNNQTFQKEDFEVIIINDGSTDNSLKIINKYSKNNDWIVINRENKGLAASRNEGLDIATGKYITFLDADDYYNVDSLETMYNEIHKNNAQVCIYRNKRFNSQNVWQDAYESIFETLPKECNINDNINLIRCIRSCPVVYLKSLINNIRFIDGYVHEDNYFCLKAYSLAQKIYISDKVVYNVRIREGFNKSITQTVNMNSFFGLFTNIVNADKEIKNKRFIKLHLNQLFSYLKKIDHFSYDHCKLYIYDYLKKMRKYNVINFYNYIYLKTYLSLKIGLILAPKKLVSFLKNNYLSFITLISPKISTKIFYKRRMGKSINLDNPKTFNEKIQWLKLNVYPKDKKYSLCADKLAVRDYIEDIGCKEILNDVYAVYDNAKDIDFDKLPNQFVIKWNFGCGLNFICKDKSKIDYDVTKKLIQKWKHQNFYLKSAEMHYKNIKKKIICEKYLENSDKTSINDYKFYCFDGNVYCVMVCLDRDKHDTKFYFFGKDHKIMKINKMGLKASDDETIELKQLDQMFTYAERLSKGFPFVRVDLYNVDGKIYFGELTFTPSAGVDTGYTAEGLLLLGNMINLKKVKK